MITINNIFTGNVNASKQSFSVMGASFFGNINIGKNKYCTFFINFGIPFLRSGCSSIQVLVKEIMHIYIIKMALVIKEMMANDCDLVKWKIMTIVSLVYGLVWGIREALAISDTEILAKCWTLSGTQTSMVKLSILEVLSRHEITIDSFLNLSKGSMIWKVTVTEGEYELTMIDDQSMMLPASTEIFRIYPASANPNPPSGSTSNTTTVATPTNTGNSGGSKTDSTTSSNTGEPSSSNVGDGGLSKDSITTIVVSLIGVIGAIITTFITVRCVRNRSKVINYSNIYA
ncbi:hypothetical protein C1645_877673 [Glomus cerebriforme]|uniref:Uncharacterized protein n=1 Tax=Glomus cerebriforme TaxID=658196 RepID=A0A397STX5_9GLOM|nr:hypothetical protein C1645_877673 [Glomus cerebriforme]